MDLRLGREDGESTYWPVLSDLSITVLMIMVLLLGLKALTSGEAQRRANALHAIQDTVARQLRAAVDTAALRIVSLGDARQKLTFQAGVLFPDCQARLSDNGRALVLTVGRVLKERARFLESIDVEGHTDLRPISDQPDCRAFQSNWELSSARATSVVRELADGGYFAGRQLKAIGRGEFVGIDSVRLKPNRRVEVVLFYSQVEAVRWYEALASHQAVTP